MVITATQRWIAAKITTVAPVISAPNVSAPMDYSLTRTFYNAKTTTTFLLALVNLELIQLQLLLRRTTLKNIRLTVPNLEMVTTPLVLAKDIIGLASVAKLTLTIVQIC